MVGLAYLASAAGSVGGGSAGSPAFALDCVAAAGTACLDSAAIAGTCCVERDWSRLREITNGVTSKGIFSRSATMLTDFALGMINSSFQGSILMRPPRGTAAIAL